MEIFESESCDRLKKVADEKVSVAAILTNGARSSMRVEIYDSVIFLCVGEAEMSQYVVSLPFPLTSISPRVSMIYLPVFFNREAVCSDT